MKITSLGFASLLAVLFLIYYLIPKKHQWGVLLLASIFFYAFAGVIGLIFILVTSVIVFLAGLGLKTLSDRSKAQLERHKNELTKDEKKAIRAAAKHKKRVFLTAAIVVVFFCLIFLKYGRFLLETANGLLSPFGIKPLEVEFSFILPLGISYYTLQSARYLADVYWGKYEAETNYLKVLLYLIFFPQITQGPLSDYSTLTTELYREHQLDYHNFSYGFQRMVWGFFKKMVVADTISAYVTTIFSGYTNYSGITCLVGALLYVIQLYADFSGYMDIMCGYCEMLDIRLTENFNRPFFSKSTAEFWRRWHISLGAWARTYIYFPVAMSKWNQKVSKKWGERLSVAIPIFFVWLFVGIWHDASWTYVLWGLCNGFIIIGSMWLEPLYDRLRRTFHINLTATWYKGFQILRTFLIFTVLETIAAVTASGGNGFSFVSRIFVNRDVPQSLEMLFPSVEGLGGQFFIMLLLALGGALLMLVFSLLQRKKLVRDSFSRIPLLVRISILLAAIIVIATAGVQASWGAGAFMYANF